MSQVILDMSISLDGVVAVPDNYRLHEWYFSENAISRAIVAKLIETTGAIVMGRGGYDMGVQFDGFKENPYQVPHFVLTHTPPADVPDGTEFVFVTDGVVAAIEQAKAAAGERHVIVGGGANIAQQCIAAGVLDEIHLHLVPLVFGKGQRLFNGQGVELEQIAVHISPGVTHLYYRVKK